MIKRITFEYETLGKITVNNNKIPDEMNDKIGTKVPIDYDEKYYYANIHEEENTIIIHDLRVLRKEEFFVGLKKNKDGSYSTYITILINEYLENTIKLKNYISLTY